MKKIAMLLFLVMVSVLPGLAANDAQNTVAPVQNDIDAARLPDGEYAAAFSPEAVTANGSTLTLSGVHIFTQDRYDAADIDALEVGDVIIVEGEPVPVLKLDREDGITINEDEDARAFDLVKTEDSDAYVVRGFNGLTTYSERGIIDLAVDASATFTDGWDIDAGPVTVGFGDIAEAITTSENHSFTQDNTTVRVRSGRVVAILRAFMP